MSSRYADDLRLAHVLADAVDQLTMSRFKAQDLEVSTKPDLTEVTDADQAAEKIVRSQLARSRSRDQVIGEEYGTTGSASRQWVIDPIDGTSNFVRGVPVWATLIGLIEDGRPVVGLVSAPSLSRRWWGGLDVGSWTGSRITNASRLQVSQVDRLEEASLSYSSLHGWADHDRLPQMLNLMQRFWRTRAYGDFWSYMLVAEGAVDAACEPELALHDMAALVPILTEAGGRFTSLEGEDGPFGGSAIATNSLLHEEILTALALRDS
ncbi:MULTISPECIES: inositol monophosphatase family protein [Brachybacterium]|uniref:Histidinol-phosphatase n=1 Tax=Brachybacterium alimentarium TaxID=47845 RepID=A0A2A3YHS6_9MICO|nr:MULTISPECIES: inositol monophosphatase family protein [Brachybacterium]PCC32867.1 histidinol phosphatase [Brachybacterium alimentarium]PCC38870.1 histidinol phosphatase [Brachybacterium alimentarium]RCS64281.1 histidinol phosphatase [Brachybacterium sp. JB7]RCS68539.1 histidinol phosphatase [Brachybacterium alimentarium]RCS72079.1 histidinol phosphatase [Brachybacterium alimentarium]